MTADLKLILLSIQAEDFLLPNKIKATNFVYSILLAHDTLKVCACMCNITLQ